MLSSVDVLCSFAAKRILNIDGSRLNAHLVRFTPPRCSRYCHCSNFVHDSTCARSVMIERGCDALSLTSPNPHAGLPCKRKLEMYTACVVNTLLYNLNTTWLSAAACRRINGFHARCCRQILHPPPLRSSAMCRMRSCSAWLGRNPLVRSCSGSSYHISDASRACPMGLPSDRSCSSPERYSSRARALAGEGVRGPAEQEQCDSTR